MLRFTFLTALSILCHTVIAQSSNELLKRSYWKENPTIEEVRSAVANGSDPAAFDGHKFNPVTWAILENASSEIVWFLLSQEGNDINLRAHDGRTPIFWAAYKNNVTLMQELIEQGARVDMIDDFGYSLVNFSAFTGQTNTKLYELCIEHGIELSNEKTKDGATPLLLIMPYLETPDMMAFFTSKGLKVEATDIHGNNAFVYAAATGNRPIMEFLRDEGIDPMANDGAAMIFAGKGTRNKTNSIETFAFLEEIGIPATVSDKEGRNALHFLSAKCTDTLVFNFFLNQGITINQADAQGNTIFLNAVASNSADIIEFLIRKRSKMPVSNLAGESALHVAVKRGDLEIVNLIIGMGTDINQKSNDGLTPLHLAAMTAKDDKILNRLIEAGADKTIKTPFEETAYDLAIENELLKVDRTKLNFLK